MHTRNFMRQCLHTSVSMRRNQNARTSMRTCSSHVCMGRNSCSHTYLHALRTYMAAVLHTHTNMHNAMLAITYIHA